MKAFLSLMVFMLTATTLYATEEGVYEGHAIHPFFRWERPIPRLGLRQFGRPLGRRSVSPSKLDRLIIPTLDLHSATFSEAVERLRQAAIDADLPDHEGVVIDTTNVPPTTAALLPWFTGSRTFELLGMLSPNTKTPHIACSFRNTPLKSIAYSFAAWAHYQIVEDKDTIIFVPQ